MIAAFLAQEGDEPATAFLNVFAGSFVDADLASFRRRFSREEQLAFARVQSGTVWRAGTKNPSEAHLRLALVRSGTEPMEAAGRLGYHADHVLWVGSVSRHLEWVRAHRRRMSKEFIVVKGETDRAVGGFPNAVLINDRETRTKRYFEELARFTVRLFIADRLRPGPNAPPEAGELSPDQERQIDAHTD